MGYSSYIYPVNYVLIPNVVPPTSVFLKLLYVLVLISPFVADAQDRCGEVEYKRLLKDRQQVKESPAQFEEWLQKKLINRQRSSEDGRTQANYQIPVVVHVIHNGEAVGSGKNIPDAQIISQINVLNKDYQRLNADASSTPPEFVPVAGAFSVEFVLAKQDPEGVATNGIVRVKGTKTSWTMSDNYQLKAESYWPAEDYLNIWVCNLTDYLGYSQFPVSGLPGLENSSTNRLTDGVVISYMAFGSADDGSFNLQNSYNKGRTTTHEVGHFFGLNHTWGDDDTACTGTDYVDDTPNQAGSTGGCPTHPRITCDVTSMFQNYLDYTNDACMNLFTIGQVSRMEVIIGNSPRRATLTTSHGLSNPAPVANDLGIKNIVRPAGGECTSSFTPSIEVRNYGSNSVSSARIQLKKDGVITETKNLSFSPAITSLDTRTVTFNAFGLNSGNHNVTFDVLLVNAVSDTHTSNNSLTQNVQVPDAIAVPFQEQFNTLPTTWDITNPDQDLTWELATTNGNNKAMKMNFYNYEDHLGEIDVLITPAFNLASAPAALLKFDVAYAQYDASKDGLKVIMMPDCSSDINLGTVVYDKSGASLSTAAATDSEFTPNPNQWRSETVDLSSFAGGGNFQLAFVSNNDWGNNLYLDNISFTTSPIHDVVLRKIITPSPVTCQEQVAPVIRVFNAGTLITSMKAVVSINGVDQTQTLSGLNLTGNTESDLTLNNVTLTSGTNEISILLTEPNGDIDFFPENNTVTITSVVNSANDAIPLRQDLETGFDGPWTRVNPNDGMNWEPIEINSNGALYVNGFANSNLGDESWLVSPVLDMSSTSEASVFFDQSYSFRSETNDVFQIIASYDCGNSFTDTLYVGSGAELADGLTSTSSWKPSVESDWKTKQISLPTLAGKENVRVAFVFTNDNGNNFYIDNIEFFVSFDPLQIDELFSVYPNPVTEGTAEVTFNLPVKGDIEIDIIDNMGKVLLTESYGGLLNQTFPFTMKGATDGVYLVRVRTEGKAYYKKVLVVR